MRAHRIAIAAATTGTRPRISDRRPAGRISGPPGSRAILGPEPASQSLTVRSSLGGGDAGAVGRERHAPDGLGVSAEDQDPLAERRVPDPDRPIAAGGDQAAAVGGEGQRVDARGVPGQGVDLPAGGEVPDLDRPIEAPGGEPPPVRADRDRADALGVGLDRPLAAARRPRPTSRMKPSLPAEARVLPSGAKATALTGSMCPLRVRTSRPASGSQSLTVRSSLAEASSLPSGAKATDQTLSVCPLRVWISRPVPTSQIRTVRSVAGRRRAAAVGADRDAADRGGVAPERPHHLARGHARASETVPSCSRRRGTSRRGRRRRRRPRPAR